MLATIIKALIIFVLILFLIVKVRNRILFSILVLSVSNILITDILKYYELPLKFNNNIYVVVNNYLWFVLISPYLSKSFKKITQILFAIILVYQLYSSNITTTFFNEYFIYTSFLYILLYGLILFKKLKREELFFFTSKKFILISSPIIFFLGKCLVFAFKSRVFSNTLVFGDITAWRLIDSIANILFYGILLIYILKSRRLKNE